MIDWMSTWAEQIIVAVIIGTIIEMILPNGNNKKYVKTVIGVYILFTIVSPIISKVTNANLSNMDINYEKYFKNTDTYQTMSQTLSTSNDKAVEDIYINNLKEDMKNKLLEKGYVASNIEIDISLDENNNYGKVKSISLTLAKRKEIEDEEDKKENIINEISINTIEKVSIGNNINTTQNVVETDTETHIKSSETSEIKEYLCGVYDVQKKNIQIN